MVTVRAVESDADLELWRQIRLAVLPNERCPTVAELRAVERPGRLMVLAELDGEVVGQGLADQSDEEGRAFLGPRVLENARRKGVGTALLRILADHATEQGFRIAGSNCDDPGSVAFAEHFGFREAFRQVEQTRAIGAEPMPEPVAGVEIVSVASRPELWAVAYHRVGRETFQDMALTGTFFATEQEWEKHWISDPEAMFLALADGEVIGVAGLMPDEEQPQRAEHAYTAVRREWRGKGVAAALKRTSLAWAAQHGITEVYTWTQRENEDMRRLNEHLGFVYGAVSVSVRAPLPLKDPQPLASS